ncbi:hypothetical protein D477_007519, partial [Arthrobacter crystallopoietes BAB-32]
MSSIRALADDLAARSDDELRALFAARPDLCLPPVPDFSALAARACTRVSLQRALEKLSRPELELMETVVLASDVDRGTAVDAQGLAPLLVPVARSPRSPAPLLQRLHALGLLVRRDGQPPAAEPAENNDGGTRLPAYLPLAGLVEVLGPYPAGMGRTHRTLAGLNPQTGSRLAAVADSLRRAGHALPAPTGNEPDADMPSAAAPAEDGKAIAARAAAGQAAASAEHGQAAAAAIEHWLGQPGVWSTLLAAAPAKTPELLERFRSSPVGAVPQAMRTVDAAAPDLQPVPWLLAHGLLVPLDETHVELPRAVGLLLRGGAVANPWHTHPPEAAGPADMRPVRPAIRDNAAFAAVAETLRLVAELLAVAADAPVATLRAGGVGVREVKRVADALHVDAADAGWLLELTAAAGLLVLDVDTSRWTVHGAEAYAALDRPLQWQLLATAWLELGRAPALVASGPGSTPGSASAGAAGPPPGAGRAASSNTPINVLAAEASRPDAPAVRRRLLAALAELAAPPSAPEPAAGTVPAPSAGFVIAYLSWQSPRLQRRFERLVPGMLEEAARLGLLGSGALTELGLLLAEDPAAAAAVLDEKLPAPLSHFMLQADLTAVAPGYLEPSVARELQLLSNAEGRGPAAVHRFSADSIRTALDAGRDAAAILDFLTRHSATGVPQPLRYLVEDTAARHGTVRVGSAVSYLRSEDAELLDDLLADPRAAGLGLRRLAPTV